MSLDRAYVNCKRCYVLADQIRGGKDFAPLVLTEDNTFWSARNEAMKALEESQVACLEACRTLGLRIENTSSALATRALNACRDCTYETARIVETIDELIK